MILKETLEHEMKDFLLQKNYPCVAGIQSLLKKDYQIGTYQSFGEARQSSELALELKSFIQRYDQTKSNLLTFWAVFLDQPKFTDLTEDEFEKRLWFELSHIPQERSLKNYWDPKFSENPLDKNFCFSFLGRAFFIVGLHPNSSRKSRRFPYPALVFNLYDQFEDLKSKNAYLPLVEANRLRDQKFQGQVNPMVEAHHDDWEAIQFSGKLNTADWQCPFKHQN